MRPRPAYVHQVVSLELAVQVRQQLPDDLVVVQELDVDLQLATPRVRIPDLQLVDGEYEESQRAEHALTVSTPFDLTIDLAALRPD